MATETKKYLDYIGLSYYDEKIKAYIKSNGSDVTDKLIALIGAAEKGANEATILARVADLEAAVGNVSELGDEVANLVKAILGENSRAVTAEGALQDAINALNEKLYGANSSSKGDIDKIQDRLTTLEEDTTDTDAVKALEKKLYGEGEGTNHVDGTIDEINAAIVVEKTRAESAENALSGRLDALETGDASVATQIKNAIEALDETKSQVAGADGLALSVTQEDGKITSISGSIAANTYDAYGSASAEETRAKGVEGELTSLTTDAKGNLVSAINEVDAHADAAQKDVNDLKVLVGTIPTSATSTTVVEYVEEIATAHDYDDTQVKADIKANKDAIDKLNGDVTTDGSVAKTVSDAIAGVVNKAPEAFDTLKEIADWIGSGEDIEGTTAANMLADISTLKTQVGTKAEDDTNNKSIYGRLEDVEAAVGEGGSVASQITAAIEGLDAEKTQTAGADGLALSITEVDGKITSISGSIAAETYDAYGAANIVKGQEADVAGTVTVYGALASAAKAQADIDAFEVIKETEINALFESKAKV